MTLEVLSTGVAGNYNGALQVVCILLIKFHFCFDIMLNYYYVCLDDVGISSSIAIGSDPGKLLR